jgi:ankyrin repeat protein
MDDVRTSDASYFVGLYGNLPVAQFLFEYVRLTVDDVGSGMYCACVCGHLYVVRYLIEHVGVTDTPMSNLLYWAKSRGHTELVQYLEGRGA